MKNGSFDLGMAFDGDADRITLAIQTAAATQKPVAVLVGDEYHGFNRMNLDEERKIIKEG